MEVGGHMHTTVFVVYMKKNQGKYFLSGKNQGIIKKGKECQEESTDPGKKELVKLSASILRKR